MGRGPSGYREDRFFQGTVSASLWTPFPSTETATAFQKRKSKWRNFSRALEVRRAQRLWPQLNGTCSTMTWGPSRRREDGGRGTTMCFSGLPTRSTSTRGWLRAAGVQNGMTWGGRRGFSVGLGYTLCGIYVYFRQDWDCGQPHFFPHLGESVVWHFFAIWPVLNRVVMSLRVWYSVQARLPDFVSGLMLQAIFGQNLRETMPNESIHNKNLPTFEFLSFFLFLVVLLALLVVPCPTRSEHLFTFKAYVGSGGGVGFGVDVSRCHGAGPCDPRKVRDPRLQVCGSSSSPPWTPGQLLLRVDHQRSSTFSRFADRSPPSLHAVR